jgi:Rha family phage regulatory protein
MTDLVSIDGGTIRVDSKTVADSFGKIHRDVLRAIENTEFSDEFRARNFAHSFYTSEQGKKLPCISMTRNGFCMVMMGFTGKKAAKWKEAFIDAFDAMEAALLEQQKGVMASLSEAIAHMEKDKDIASASARALAKWKRVRKQHIDTVTEAHQRAQLVLNFK